MLEYYILCKHLVEAVEKQQPLDRHLQLISDAVKAQEFEIVEDDLVVEVVPSSV